ncbi:MAG: hypothetical protein NTX50_16735, partial [Candidatus Sumerlaeota bacterium]|nr:hypothetical protein [Candidatus Sumerlaeota bacterium]
MPRHPIIILSLALALAMAPAPAALAQSKPPAPDIEVLYIPHDALPNAPGYSPEGVFLPLSQLLTLAREAGRAGGAKPLPDAVRCPSIELSGVLDVGLTLDGRIVFEAPRAEWSATLINDGGMPWASQSVSSGTLAFLARAEGKTYLYAKGPAKGAVTVRAAIAPPFSGANAVLSLGRFYAPCRVDIGLAAGVQFTSATAPATVQSQGVDTAKLNLAKMWISVWPSQDEEARVYLQRRIPWQAPAALRAKLNRTAIAAGGDGLEIQDELLLEDRFAPGSPVRLAFPEELRLLEASAEGAARLDVTSSGAVLMPLKEGSALSVRARFMAYARGGSVVLAPWGIQSAAGAPPAAQSASLTLRPSERDAPFLKTRPAGLFPAGGDGRERRYDFWGAPPAMEVALARSTAPQPPQAESQLAIVRNEATLRTQLRFKDANREDLAFAVPAEWILADLKAASGSQAAPFSLQEQEAGQWRVSWDPAQPPDLIELTLHRSGAWGAPGTSATLEVPFLRVGQPQPLRHEMTVTWPEEMDAQAVRLSSVEVAAAAQAQAQAQVFAANAPAQQSARSAAPAAIERRSGAANLALRATGERPKGALDIRGRETDAQAVVATSLQIAEDRVTVRAAILYTVRFAPANTFRFTLPAGTGRNVRISGLGVRETTMNPTPEGDEWTVAMRQGVLGAFELEMEWSPSANPAAQAVAAPKIIAQAVSSQRGFLVVEGSETLRLSMKTENLSEADLSELPPVFWTRAGKLGRVLAVWRYVNPPYALTVTAEKFKTEPPLRGLAREAKIVTTLSPSGERFTRAAYSIAPTSDRQFFEARLPEGAQLWAALVNGKGVMPARRREGASQWILAPLPAASASASDCGVTLIYRELGMPLDTLRRLEVKSPELPIPINRTSWDLNLPPGYEYLGFRGDSGKLSVVSDPAARFFRTAY